MLAGRTWRHASIITRAPYAARAPSAPTAATSACRAGCCDPCALPWPYKAWERSGSRASLHQPARPAYTGADQWPAGHS